MKGCFDLSDSIKTAWFPPEIQQQLSPWLPVNLSANTNRSATDPRMMKKVMKR